MSIVRPSPENVNYLLDNPVLVRINSLCVFPVTRSIVTSQCVCLLMTSSKSCSFGNEQTETGRFGSHSLNRFRPRLCHFGPCGKTFQSDLNQTQEQNNLMLRQGGMCLGNMV